MYFVSSAPLLFWSDTYHTAGLFLFNSHSHTDPREKSYNSGLVHTYLGTFNYF